MTARTADYPTVSAHSDGHPTWDYANALLAERDQLREAFKEVSVEWDRYKAALEEIAAQPIEREVQDVHLGMCLYPVPNRDAVDIARAALNSSSTTGDQREPGMPVGVDRDYWHGVDPSHCRIWCGPDGHQQWVGKSDYDWTEAADVVEQMAGELNAIREAGVRLLAVIDADDPGDEWGACIDDMREALGQVSRDHEGTPSSDSGAPRTPVAPGETNDDQF